MHATIALSSRISEFDLTPEEAREVAKEIALEHKLNEQDSEVLGEVAGRLTSPFYEDPELAAEIEASIEEAERGEVEDFDVVLARLREQP